MREPILMLHFIGLAMGLGSGLAFLFLGMAAGKMEPAKRAEFLLNAFPIARMGQFGLLLLVLTGGYLMTPYWGALAFTPLLVAKLSLVLVLGAVVGINSSYARKARQGNAAMYMAKIAVLGRVALLTSLTIVVLAVLVFR
ncbi:MAG: hypothetical protein ABI432_04535 [Flavobacteriales bacterium]